MEEQGIGFDVGVTKVPVIPTAVLYDLENGDAFCRPDKEMGRQACENASHESLAQGDVGAGCGATVGKLRGTLGWCNSGIRVIATNVKLTKAQAAIVAGMAHDGLARCTSPVHTTLDGDTLFCLSTKEIELPTVPVDLVGIMAAKVTEQAVLCGVRAAKPF